MLDSPEPFAPFTPELLVASCALDGTLLNGNEAWQSIFGKDTNPWSHLAPEDQPLIQQCIKEAALGLLVTNQIFPVSSDSRDEPLPVLLNFLPVHFQDATGQMKVQAITITGEALAEPTTWTVSQTQRHRLETLGRMTMGIAHDFNNLLSGIIGYTELLKTFVVGEPLPPAFPEHLSTIEKASMDGAALVRKIQQYIRREKKTRFETLDVPSLIQDCILFTRPYWYNEPRRQGIDIQLKLDLQEVPPVMGSGSELREVFVNLILNAVQAMPKGGELVLATGCSETEGVTIRVSDTGMGMSETVRARIFEPLFTTKGVHGTGMGLAVSNGIIQEHDGTIKVESTLGVGTTFLLTLPPAEYASSPEPSETEEQRSKVARVLLVDDEQMVRSVLTKLLALRGHSVWAVGSGAEALVLAETHPLDIVIVDQAMPEMNGRELATILHRRYPSLPVVLLTGDTETGEPGNGISEILSKPFQINEVEATIQRLILSSEDQKSTPEA